MPGYVNVAFCGNRVFGDDQVKMTSSGWAPIQYYCCLYKRGKFKYRGRHTQREDRKKGMEQILPHNLKKEQTVAKP